MDLRVKIAKNSEDIFCEYTNEPSRVLVKIGNDGKDESGWMGQQALEQALAMITSLQGGVQIGKRQDGFKPRDFDGEVTTRTLEYRRPSIEEEVVQVEKKTTSRDQEWAKAFYDDCVRLAKNPSPNAKGEATGVSELEIRQLIALWKPRFSNPTTMAGPLEKIFGMSRDRFDTVIDFC